MHAPGVRGTQHQGAFQQRLLPGTDHRAGIFRCSLNTDGTDRAVALVSISALTEADTEESEYCTDRH